MKKQLIRKPSEPMVIFIYAQNFVIVDNYVDMCTRAYIIFAH